MSAVDAARLALITSRLLASPAAAKLNLVLDQGTGNAIRLRMPFDLTNVTEGATVHGGVIATLIDVAAVAGAVASARELPSAGATSSLAISYLAPAEGCELIAKPRVLRGGERQHIVRVEIADPDGRAVAEALATVVLG